MDSQTGGLETLPPKIPQLLRAVAKKEGFSDPTFIVSPGSKKGENFIGVIHRVKIEDNRKTGLSVIVKSQPDNEALSIELGVPAFFLLESHFYNVILPAFVTFQMERGITDKFAPSCPKCYHASSTAIILEDMVPHGFLIRDRKKEEISIHHCRVVIRELAQFHAVSLALNDQNPTLFRQLTKDMKDTFLVQDRSPNLVLMYDNAVKNALANFKERAVVDDKKKYESAFERFSNDYYKTLLWLVTAKNAEPYSVINHGDCWDSNFLYKYGEDGKLPTGMCLLDYQLVRNTSPATDVSYFMFCCANKAIRDQYYDSLLTEYHSTLADYIRLLGSDPDKLFPLETFYDQLKMFGKYGLGLAVFEIPIFTSDSADKPVPDEPVLEDVSSKTSLENNFNITHSNECWSRINHVVIDMVDKGYIV